jgi:hypothetical protein
LYDVLSELHCKSIPPGIAGSTVNVPVADVDDSMKTLLYVTCWIGYPRECEYEQLDPRLSCVVDFEESVVISSAFTEPIIPITISPFAVINCSVFSVRNCAEPAT